MQEKSRNLSGQQEEESVIWDKMSCINGCIQPSNLFSALAFFRSRYTDAKWVHNLHVKNKTEFESFLMKKYAGRQAEISGSN